jgi:hypothetical protein
MQGNGVYPLAGMMSQGQKSDWEKMQGSIDPLNQSVQWLEMSTDPVKTHFRIQDD